MGWGTCCPPPLVLENCLPPREVRRPSHAFSRPFPPGQVTAFELTDDENAALWRRRGRAMLLGMLEPPA